MELHNLKTIEGSSHSGKRVGRGIGSGMGKTSTRGQKGAGARSGGAINPGFEGGQTPLYRRIPKRGFKNVNRKEYAILNVSDLNKLEGFDKETVIDLALLMEMGLIKDPKCGLKILGDGDLNVALTIAANKFSTLAKDKIIKAGGEVKEL